MNQNPILAADCLACGHIHSVDGPPFKDHGCRSQCGCQADSSNLQIKLKITKKGRNYLKKIQQRDKLKKGLNKPKGPK
jgi:hypothetical protein